MSYLGLTDAMASTISLFGHQEASEAEFIDMVDGEQECGADTRYYSLGPKTHRPGDPNIYHYIPNEYGEYEDDDTDYENDYPSSDSDDEYEEGEEDEEEEFDEDVEEDDEEEEEDDDDDEDGEEYGGYWGVFADDSDDDYWTEDEDFDEETSACEIDDRYDSEEDYDRLYGQGPGQDDGGSYHYEKDEYHFHEDDNTQQEIDYPEDPGDEEESENNWAREPSHGDRW
ncbi:hypothetical protein N0V84_000977 [Fusarium piperis]|uniref:Uncharacterized protein n=1 Tax=Fusarium piperis TaxID=1435070 RepID=A0A9W8WMJ3_9HYPO|nr:hypothetical protein N0V84_000977 [Fusarium piperis]